MAQNILFTLDVEALPARAKDGHLDKLIFGKFGRESYGINRIFDIADKFGIQLTCFFDYTAYPRYGEKYLDIARYIHDRKQDLQLHTHPDILGDKFWQEAGIEAEKDLRFFSKAQAEALISYIVSLHEKTVGVAPLAFRGGAYKLNAAILEALAKHNIKYDSTYNPGRACLDFNIGNHAPFTWSCGVTELPIPFLSNFLDYPKAFEFNFNNYYFQKYDADQCVTKMLDFLEEFLKKFPAALPVLVMHSWSFLKLNKSNGHYDSINYKAAEIFEEFCRKALTKYQSTSCAELAANNFTGLEELNYKANMLAPAELNGKKSGKCNICASGKFLKSFNSSVKRYCNKCKSLERQRTLAKLLDFASVGIDLRDKAVLHLGGANCEKEILKTKGARSRILDVRPEADADIVADICNMPQVPSKAFDYILCCQILPHVHDLQSALRELARVLKDDGGLLQCNNTNVDLTTQEITDPEEISKWYGKENYEKHRVGSFRNFGEIGLEDLFKPYFRRERYEIRDDVTGQKIYWNLWRKIEAPQRDKPDQTPPQKAADPRPPQCEKISFSQIYLRADPQENMREDIIIFRPAGRADLPEFEISLPFNWNADPFHDANWQAQLHMWRFLDPYLLKYETTRDNRWLAKLVESIQDWAAFYRANPPGKYVWKDMLTGMRAMKLAWILAAHYSGAIKFGSHFIKICEQLRDEHLKFLLNEKRIAYSNHTYIDLHGAMALAQVSTAEKVKEIAEFVREKLTILLSKQFDADGVHCENSPQYQAFGISRLKNMLKSGWFDEFGLPEMAAKATNILSLMYQPDGRLVSVGDTDGDVRAPSFEAYEGGPELHSHGGYVIVRARTAQHASYLFFMGAFNAQLHKHSDDLSLTWYENCQILHDGGKYAYGNSPERDYIISTRAHNTLEIDNLNTHEFGDADQFISYGSKIKLTFAAHDCFGIVAEMNIGKFKVFHKRSLIYKPGAFLLVFDTVRAKEAHLYKLHWHYTPKIKNIYQDQTSCKAELPTGEALYIGWQGSSPLNTKWISGQTKPRLHGFVSPSYKKLEPDHCLQLSLHAKKADILTVMSVDKEMKFSCRKGRWLEFAWEGRDYIFDLKENSLTPREEKKGWRDFLNTITGK